MNTNTKRIILDGRMILPHMTGVGRYLMGLAPKLADVADLDVVLWLQSGLSANHPVWDLGSGNLSLQSVPYRHMSLSSQWGLPFQVARTAPDLFHYPHFDLPFGIPGKIIATIHDLKYVIYPSYFTNHIRLKQLIMTMMMKYTCWRAGRVIVVSENTARDLVTNLGVPTSKIRVVHLGVNKRFFQRNSAHLLQTLCQKYQLTSPYILFVGERRPHKNIIGLIRAFRLFNRMVSGRYSLVIAGKKYADYKLPEKAVEEFGLSDRVCFLDDLPDADLPALYQSAEVVGMLSHYEGFGLPVLEAMASGTPVVASRRTSLPEVAGDAAMLVEPDQPEEAAIALKCLIRGGSLRETKIAAGVEQAKRFTWEACAFQTLAIYQEVMA